MDEPLNIGIAPEEAAPALNEQGYLLQMRVQQALGPMPDGKLLHPWVSVAEEYPVTGGEEQLTRIDLVYRHANFPGLYAAIECKRPNPKYKHWIFFGPNPQSFGKHSTYVETLRSINATHPGSHQHTIENPLVEVPSFRFYLEAAKERGSGKHSFTETIEKAFRQSIIGQIGLLRKLADHVTMGGGNRISWLRVVPIVVTTAPILVADFNSASVELRDGNVNPSDLKIRAVPFLSVDYHADDDLRLASRFCRLTPGPDPMNDIRLFQTRTVFVVQAEHLVDLLCELADKFVIRD